VRTRHVLSPIPETIRTPHPSKDRRQHRLVVASQYPRIWFRINPAGPAAARCFRMTPQGARSIAELMIEQIDVIKGSVPIKKSDARASASVTYGNPFVGKVRRIPGFPTAGGQADLPVHRNFGRFSELA